MACVRNYRQAGFNSVLEELQWRGLINKSTDEQQLAKELEGSITFYAGFDPTAASLHIGNLVTLIVMRHLQEAGHKPCVLIGGSTGLIGDPRQSGERVLQDKQIVAHWSNKLAAQISKILPSSLSCQDDCASINTDASRTDNQEMSENLPTVYPAIYVNNYDWTSQLSAIDFLRDIGKHFRVGTMLSKDIVARRLQSHEGISFTEFTYQILQGYDFLHLYDKYNCTLQIGGSDQWGNLTSGLDLIRKVHGVSVNVLTTPIITDSEGKKFGKSEGNAVWLDSTMLSAYHFYQFWLNQPDDQMEKLLKVFTFLPKQDIELLVQESIENPGMRQAQKTLAYEVTSFVHGEHATQQAIQASCALFGRGTLQDLEKDTLQAALDGFKVSLHNNEETQDNDGKLRNWVLVHIGDRLIDVVVQLSLAKSASEARKTIRSGGLYINNERIEDEDYLLQDSDFLHHEFIIIRRGKKALSAAQLDQ